MFLRKARQRLEVEVTSIGLSLAWECSPGVVVRRRFTSASLACAAAEALRSATPGTLEAAIAVLEQVVREHPQEHREARPGQSARTGHTLHRRPR